MTTINASARRGSSILAVLLIAAITTIVIGGMFGLLAFKVKGAVEQRNQQIEQQIDTLGGE